MEQQIVYYVPQRTTTDNAVSVLMVILTLVFWTFPGYFVGGIVSLMFMASGDAGGVIVGLIVGVMALVIATLPLWLVTKL